MPLPWLRRSKGSDARSTAADNETVVQRALHIPEIVFAIFDEFDPLHPDDLATCALASRVCHSFAEPASCVVWHRLTSLLPLWSIFNNTLQSENTWNVLKIGKNRNQHTAAPPDTVECIRGILRTNSYADPLKRAQFLRCARRVQVLDYLKYHPGELSLIRLLSRDSNSPSLFPSLRRLRCIYANEPDVSLLPLLAPPLLHTLDLTYAPLTEPQVLQKLPSSLRSFHGLSALSVTWESLFQYDQHDLQSVIDAALECSNLQRFEWRALCKDGHIHLSSVAKLATSLTITSLSIRAQIVDDLPRPSDYVHLPRIRHLRWTCFQKDPLIDSFSSRIRAPLLVDFALSMEGDEPADFLPCMQNLSASPIARTLRRISLDFSLSPANQYINIAHTTQLASFLEPLFNLPSECLESLSVHVPEFSVYTANVDLQTVAKALGRLSNLRELALWPIRWIKVLDIPGVHGRPSTRVYTQISMPPVQLALFARYFSHLVTLQLGALLGVGNPAKAGSVPIEDLALPHDEPAPCLPGLRKLSGLRLPCHAQGEAWAGCPEFEALATLLSTLFPNLDVPRTLHSLSQEAKESNLALDGRSSASGGDWTSLLQTVQARQQGRAIN